MSTSWNGARAKQDFQGEIAKKKTRLQNKTSTVGWPPTGLFPSGIGSQIGYPKGVERDLEKGGLKTLFSKGFSGFWRLFKLGVFGGSRVPKRRFRGS